MAIKKEVDVFVNVNDKDLKTLNSDLGKTEQSFKDVQTEANKTSKSVDNVASNGGAIAILDQLTGGLATRFKDAFEASKLFGTATKATTVATTAQAGATTAQAGATTAATAANKGFNISLKATKTALIATGIGAFVVLLGLTVAYWSDIKDFINGTNAALNRQIDLQSKVVDELERGLKSLDSTGESLKRQGKTEKEIRDLKKEKLAIIINERKAEIELERTRLVGLKKLRTEGGASLEQFARKIGKILDFVWKTHGKLLSFFGLDNDLEAASARANNVAFEYLFGTQEDIAESEKLLKNYEDELEVIQNRLDGIRNKEDDENIAAPRDKVVSVLDPNLKSEQVKVLDDLKGFEFKKTEIEEVASDNRIEIARREAMAKAEAMSSYSDSLASISGVIGQQTVEGKALAVASSLISTYASISGTLAAFSGVPVPGYAIAQAIATGVVGFANVKKIIDVKVPGGGAGGGGGSVPSVGGGTRAPEFNLVKGTASNQIAESIQGQDQPIKTFVVSSDVTSSQELSRTIEGDSSL
tara:strand:+ start:8395 stop:9984 length:1590 start_codon:yes stop_codon:yes gene_type:complete